jgi:hypothetical protein
MLINPASLTAVLLALWTKRAMRHGSSHRGLTLVLVTGTAVAAVFFTVVGLWFRGENWVLLLPLPWGGS